MKSALYVISACFLVAALSSHVAGEDGNQLPGGDTKIEIKVTPSQSTAVPSGSLSIETLNHLPVGSSPVAAQVTVKSTADKLASPVVVGNFMLFGEDQPAQGYTFDVKKHLNANLLSDLEKGEAMVTVTVRPTGQLPDKNFLELKSATFAK